MLPESPAALSVTRSTQVPAAWASDRPAKVAARLVLGIGMTASGPPESAVKQVVGSTRPVPLAAAASHRLPSGSVAVSLKV